VDLRQLQPPMGWPRANPSGSGHGWRLTASWVASPKKKKIKSELSPSSLNLIVLSKNLISHLFVPLFDSLIKRWFNKKADQPISLILHKKKKKIKSLQFRSLPEWAKISSSTHDAGLLSFSLQLPFTLQSIPFLCFVSPSL
jgi:hypothetical protein